MFIKYPQICLLSKYSIIIQKNRWLSKWHSQSKIVHKICRQFFCQFCISSVVCTYQILFFMNIENHMTLMYKNFFNRTTALCVNDGGKELKLLEFPKVFVGLIPFSYVGHITYSSSATEVSVHCVNQKYYR